MTDEQLFTIVASVIGVGLSLAALTTGLFAGVRSDIKANRTEMANAIQALRTEAAADRQASESKMEIFRQESESKMEIFRQEMQRLAERQAHVEGRLHPTAAD